MDILSPARTCDPWAVRSAKTFEETSGATAALGGLQQRIVDFLATMGHADLKTLTRELGIKSGDAEREIAALRHMERVRGAIIEGKKVIKLW